MMALLIMSCSFEIPLHWTSTSSVVYNVVSIIIIDVPLGIYNFRSNGTCG